MSDDGSEIARLITAVKELEIPHEANQETVETFQVLLQQTSAIEEELYELARGSETSYENRVVILEVLRGPFSQIKIDIMTILGILDEPLVSTTAQRFFATLLQRLVVKKQQVLDGLQEAKPKEVKKVTFDDLTAAMKARR